ncbi:GIY-YIG nuclease family protein [Polaribacter marinivivus]|uniref:GIY-YIG nuclease family protein n=1 Tax=Polaribacter marinivivus TaxID=1524260 RepID=UPI003D330A09
MKKLIGTHNYYVYILTNKNKAVLYVGVTNNLFNRLHEHKNPETSSKNFTKRYNCFYLVYYEHFNSIATAIIREKQIKRWNRSKKNKLIESFNPNWIFLNNEFGGSI